MEQFLVCYLIKFRVRGYVFFLDQMIAGNILTKTTISIDLSVAHGHNWDIKEDNGQMSTEVEIRLHMSHNALTTAEEHLR